VTIQGPRKARERAAVVIDRALTAEGFPAVDSLTRRPDQRRPRHLRAVPDSQEAS
jgi:hypothetical protein